MPAKAKILPCSLLALAAAACSADFPSQSGSGIGQDPEPAGPAGPPVKAKKGLGFVPSSDSEEYLRRCFELLRRGARIAVVHRRLFEDDAATLAVYDDWLARAREAGLETYVAMDVFAGDQQDSLRVPADWQGEADWSNAEWLADYRAAVLDAVRKHRLDYLNLAIEVNTYYAYHRDRYDAFREVYRRLRDEVKKLSPDTKVFCSFQYEYLLGKASPDGRSQWELLDEKKIEQDVFGVTTYPLFREADYDPTRLPDDYYAPLGRRTSLPLFFAEIGWYSSPSASHESSESKQARYVRRLRSLLQGLDVEAVCWVGLSDPPRIPELAELWNSYPEFFSLALCESDLKPKRAWQEWLRLDEPIPDRGGRPREGSGDKR